MRYLPFEPHSAQNLIEGYNAWATTYDRDVGLLEYASPLAVAESVCRQIRNKDARLLDVGAGTGLVGELLRHRGYHQLIGLDCSQGMLRQAVQKGHYQLLCRMALGQPLGFPDRCFDAIVAAGVFTPGHAPPESLLELIRVLRPGGMMIFSLKWDGCFNDILLAVIDKMVSAGQLERQSWSERYASWPGVNSNQQSRVLSYQLLC